MVYSPKGRGGGGGKGDTFPKYLNGYVPPNGVVILGTHFRDDS